MKNCFIYCRQSSGSGDAVSSLSIQQQLTNCLELSRRMDLEVAGVFTDANVSGKTYPSGSYFEETAATDRGFQRWFEQQTGSKKFRTGLGSMMERLDEVDFIIVDEITRLHRAAANSFLEQVLTFELTNASVKIIQVKGGVLDLKSFDQSLIHLLKTRINDEQIANQKRKSIESRKKLKDSGIFCNVKFYGAVYDGNKRFHYDPGHAEVISHVFDRFTAAVPVSVIVKEVNRMFPGRFNQAKCFYASTVKHIVTQPLYAGLMYDSGGELITCRNAPEPLISEAQFFKAAALMADHQCHASKPRGETPREPLIFSGFLRCSNCGSNLVAVYDRNRIVYKCRNGDYGGNMLCRESRVLISGGISDAWGLKMSLMPLLIIGCIKKQKLIEMVHSASAVLAQLTQKEQYLLGKVNAAFQLWEEDVLDEKAYRTSVRNCMAKIQKVRQEQLEIKSLHLTEEEFLRQYCKYKEVIERILLCHPGISNTDYREMLNECIDHISVAKDSVTVLCSAGVVTLPRVPCSKRQLRVMPRSELKLVQNGENSFYELYFYCRHSVRGKKLLLEWENLKIWTLPGEKD